MAAVALLAATVLRYRPLLALALLIAFPVATVIAPRPWGAEIPPLLPVVAVVLATELRGADTTAAAADAYGTAFWWSVGMAALAVIPCVILMRAESNARKAAAAAGEEDPDVVAIESGAVAEAVA